MMRLSITVVAGDAQNFLIQVQGELRRPKSLNDALGRRLARELQGHFLARNKEPNQMQAPKTNFWKQVSDATVMTSADEHGAVVSIAERRFRIHLFGGTIRPTNGRKFLTIPLVREARGKRVSEYEARTGRKLFRPGFKNVLLERSAAGTTGLIGGRTVTVRRRGAYREIGTPVKGKARAIYALKKQVTIKADPRALPATAKLVQALSETADAWVARQTQSPS